MLIRDGEQLNLNAKELDETTQWVKAEIDKIKKTKRVYVFKSTMKPQKLIDDKGGLHIDHRNYSAPKETNFVNPHTGVAETWFLITSGSSFKKGANGVVDIRREKSILIPSSGKFLDSRTEAETIFYLKEISKSFKKNKFFLEDKEKEAKVFNEELMLQDAAMVLISSPTSPISLEATGTEDIMRQLALSFRVHGVDGMNYSSLRIALRNAVVTSQEKYIETQLGYKEFINMANRLGDTEKRSTIMLAIERGVLIYEDGTWSVKGREGELKHLRSIPLENASRKDDYIIKFLVSEENESFYTLVEDLAVNPVPEKIIPLPKSNGMNRQEMLKYCKEDLGWHHTKVFSKTDDELRKIIDEGMKPEK